MRPEDVVFLKARKETDNLLTQLAIPSGYTLSEKLLAGGEVADVGS